MRKLNSRKATVAIGTAAAVVTLAGIASAYYLGSVSGSGTGSAATANTTVGALTFAASSITGLVPNGPAVNATVTFTNPNSFSVSYPAKTIAVSSVSGPTGCADNTVALLSGSANLPATVLGPNATTTVTVPVSMADSATVNQSSCNNASFTVTYSAS